MNLTHLKKDYLTGCYQRDGFHYVLEELAKAYEHDQKPFSVFVADVDRFKKFNDKHGHLCGDEVLKFFSNLMHIHITGVQNIPFRFGGDEFVVVVDKDDKETLLMARQLKQTVEARPFHFRGHILPVTFSAGIASFPQDTWNVEELFDKADQSLYVSKKRGRAQTTVYSDAKFQRVRSAVAWVILIGLVLLSVFYLREPLVVFKDKVIDFISSMRISFKKAT